jgi:hypothetical protein
VTRGFCSYRGAPAERVGVNSLDVRVGRQLTAVVRRFLKTAAGSGFEVEHALGRIGQIAVIIESSGCVPQLLVDELRSCYSSGVVSIEHEAPETQRAILGRQWDEALVLGNLASDLNAVTMCYRTGGASRSAIEWIHADGNRWDLDGAATYELPARGEIAKVGGAPYVRNLWSSRPGLGSQLICHIRDLSCSEALLVKPLSPKLREYYRQHHHGEPASWPTALTPDRKIVTSSDGASGPSTVRH